jgi:site-specific recombinase XerD
VLRGKQETVIVPGGGTIFDAANELYEWMGVREALGIPGSAPLFCHSSGAMITVDELRDVVKAAMEAAGRDPARYGAHSLRIGGATAALAAGVPPQLIRLLGRWSSDVYQIYCRMSSQAAIQAGQQLASADVDALERGFQEEHLELLPAEVADFRRMAVGGDDDDVE